MGDFHLANFVACHPRQMGKTALSKAMVECAVKKNAYFLALKDEIRRAGFPKRPSEIKRVNKLFRYIGKVPPTRQECQLIDYGYITLAINYLSDREDFEKKIYTRW